MSDLALLVAPPPALRPAPGRAWWQAGKAGVIVLPPSEQAAIPSALERLAAPRHSFCSAPAEPAPRLKDCAKTRCPTR